MPPVLADTKEVKEKVVKEPKAIIVKNVAPVINTWWYKGEDDESGVNYGSKARCFVHADDMKDAIRLLNLTFVIPVTLYEFTSRWKPGSDATIIHQGRKGVWNMINGAWLEREVKKNRA